MDTADRLAQVRLTEGRQRLHWRLVLRAHLVGVGDEQGIALGERLGNAVRHAWHEPTPVLDQSRHTPPRQRSGFRAVETL